MTAANIIALRCQFPVQHGSHRLRRETGRETVPHFDGFDVSLRTAAFQCGAETARIMEQQPMARRHRGDAAGVYQTPVHHLRVFSLGVVQRAAQIRARLDAVNIRKRREKIARVFMDARGQGAPIAHPDFFRQQHLAQRGNGPRGLGAGAPVILPAQALGLGSRSQTKGGARFQVKDHFRAGVFAGRRFLAEQVILQRAKAGAFAAFQRETTGSGGRPCSPAPAHGPVPRRNRAAGRTRANRPGSSG